MQGTLRNLGLIGGVGGKEFAALHDVLNHGRAVVVIETTAQEGAHGDVAHAQVVKETAHFNLTHGLGQLILLLELEFLGHILIEVVQRLDACRVQHGLQLIASVRKKFITHCLSVLSF